MHKVFALLFCLLASAGPAFADSAPHWVEVRSPHFVVLTDTNEKGGRKIAGQFERMRALFHAVLPNASGDAGLPIEVVAFRDKKGFASVVPSAYLAKGQLQLAGYFLRTPDRNYILLRLDAEGENPYSTVYHEYTHFILRKAEWIPLWLNEGLAEFYQNTDIEEKDVRLGQPSTGDILYLRQNRLLPLPVLFTVDHSSPYYHDEQKGSVFYAESWALTHYIEITDSENKTHRLEDYSHLLVKGEDPVTAAKQAFGDLNQLQKDLDHYISQDNYRLFKVNLSFTADEASFVSRPISSNDVDAVRADVLADNDRKEEAKALVEQVLRNDPKNALAHETMGSLAYRDHDLAAAKKWYREATQLDSESYIAYYYSAVLSTMKGGSDDESTEANLRKCIKLEPTFAPAYDALARSLSKQRKNLDEAHMLTLQAVQLEPEELHYRINAAQVLIEQKKLDSALRVLEEASDHVAKTPEQVAEVQSRIAQVKSYRAALAGAEVSRSSSGPAASMMIMNSTTHTSIVARPDDERVYPTASPSAARHTVRGVVHNVKCSYPTVLTLDLDRSGKTVSLFTSNYFKVTFTTANYTQTGDLDPCKAIDGMKASIEYADVTDETLVGQVLSIELSR